MKGSLPVSPPTLAYSAKKSPGDLEEKNQWNKKWDKSKRLPKKLF